MAAGHSVELAGWQVIFDELMGRVAGRFGRVEPRPTARDYLLGLLSGIECKLLEPGRECRACRSAGDAAHAVHRTCDDFRSGTCAST